MSWVWVKNKMKFIKLSELVEILWQFNQESIVHSSERSFSWNFNRSLNFLQEKDLSDHIAFAPQDQDDFPIDSELNQYGIINVIIQNLQIELDSEKGLTIYSDWQHWRPLSRSKLHFENCYFEAQHADAMYSVIFPWNGHFRFYKNKFDFPTSEYPGYWIFPFEKGSRVTFQQNDFKKNEIQSICSSEKVDNAGDDQTNIPTGVSFVSNRGISRLHIGGYTTVSITGANRIERLAIDEMNEINVAKSISIFFGLREKIDQDFHYCSHHRNLFLWMRRLAAAKEDARQISILDKHIDRIEYFLNKELKAPCILDYSIWVQYWQDRILYAWRRWSSDFYRSWMRPLCWLVLGYLLLNAAPALYLENFTISHWIEFNLRSVGEIAKYESSLEKIFGVDYESISLRRKNILRTIGFVEVIWIAMWSFAFVKAIKR